MGKKTAARRSVTIHVGSILNKTGAANRPEAASYATRHGLAEEAEENSP
jgi:DNA-binding CsgD family transcriptional regulator